MAAPEGAFRPSWPGPPGRGGPAARGPQATILGTLTIPGRPEQVRLARAFVSRVLREHQAGDIDTATLLTSEIVTNAIAHTRSGAGDGTVTIVVISIAPGVLVEVTDEGSAGTPVVKDERYEAEGHGLFLVQHLAAQWGYVRNPAGTTVWFHLAGADQTVAGREPASPRGGTPARPASAGAGCRMGA
jgi:anti-sigma regulatory factor (Ser/Thr protein kinase)